MENQNNKIYKVDINKDGSIDVTDVIQLVNIVLAS